MHLLVALLVLSTELNEYGDGLDGWLILGGQPRCEGKLYTSKVGVD